MKIGRPDSLGTRRVETRWGVMLVHAGPGEWHRSEWDSTGSTYLRPSLIGAISALLFQTRTGREPRTRTLVARGEDGITVRRHRLR